MYRQARQGSNLTFRASAGILSARDRAFHAQSLSRRWIPHVLCMWLNCVFAYLLPPATTSLSLAPRQGVLEVLLRVCPSCHLWVGWSWCPPGSTGVPMASSMQLDVTQVDQSPTTISWDQWAEPTEKAS
ncbi:hypothetical protein FIBSPDRAFT_516556 [Athelia psychrophila]|uniref:Uncharacterized protein n=1 Tax=Athelia psychrophila TaxID=1759441 RepID=A0A166V573_9AGAM|nr:hypothetical protein FIBSPDRAFT_516556 [Fibularhizoctonia sp. CBS 109695]